MCEAVKLVLPIDAEPLVFIELNDPLRMPAEDYARDTAFTGLDQIDRIRIWAKQGARVVDHPYVQPPLAPDGEPDDNLIYGLLSDVPAIDACILRDHLRQFFGISVLKGAPLRTSASASGQIETLDAHCTSGARIALLDPQRFLGRVRCRDDIGTVFPVWPESARAAIRQSA